jgi:putative acetyltransferase
VRAAGGRRQLDVHGASDPAEKPRDYKSIARVVETAFADPNVVRLVERIRASEQYVPELSLVAEHEGDIVGHMMFSYVTLRREHDEKPVVILSPLAAAPERQKDGIGSALVRAGIAGAEARNEPLVIVEGTPAYYPRFGFERAREHGIEPPSAHIPDAAFMVLRLSSYEVSLRGTVVYSPAFDVVATG